MAPCSTAAMRQAAAWCSLCLMQHLLCCLLHLAGYVQRCGMACACRQTASTPACPPVCLLCRSSAHCNSSCAAAHARCTMAQFTFTHTTCPRCPFHVVQVEVANPGGSYKLQSSKQVMT